MVPTNTLPQRQLSMCFGAGSYGTQDPFDFWSPRVCLEGYWIDIFGITTTIYTNLIPSGKLTWLWKDPPFSMGKSPISMAVFNSKLLNCQRVYIYTFSWDWTRWFGRLRPHLRTVEAVGPSRLIPLAGGVASECPDFRQRYQPTTGWATNPENMKVNWDHHPSFRDEHHHPSFRDANCKRTCPASRMTSGNLEALRWSQGWLRLGAGDPGLDW